MSNPSQLTETERVVIGRRFNGPPSSGNGGYVCGVVAARIAGSAEVTLRVPPPLETPLTILRDDSGVRLMDRAILVAQGQPAEFDLDVPAPPSFEEAEAAVPGYSGFVDHTFSTCFVCGPEREAGDGLRVFAGPIARNATVAAPWTPDESLAVNGEIPAEILWAAMDCPGAFAIMDRDVPLVLGRMAAAIYQPVCAGDRCVVLGWALGNEGRKHYAGTALFTDGGDLVAKAFQSWIELKQ